MKDFNLLHPQSRLTLYSLTIWLWTIALFMAGLFMSPFIKNQLIQKNFGYIILFDIGLGILSFVVMMISAAISVFGKKLFLLIPILVLLFVYFTFIFPKNSQKKIVQSITQPNSLILLSSNLSIGSTGDEVCILQAALTIQKYLPNNLVTGYYGDRTRIAVESFQKDIKVPINGIVDEKTRRVFNEQYGKDHGKEYYLSLIPTQTILQNNVTDSNNRDTSKEWGVSERVSGTEHGWTMKVGNDPVMGTAQEIFDALNLYRSKKGVRGLNWDGNLGSYAQQRVADLVVNGGVDDHKGFREYISNSDNRRRLGFYGLGENASCGFRLTGTHIIEWLFAGDAPHENNQLDSNWSDVGIGVSNTCVILIFGYDRMN